MSKKEEKPALAASATVEIALIFPIILTVILALVQLCLWQHDKLVLQGALNQSSLYATAQSKGEYDSDFGYRISKIATARQFFSSGEDAEKLQQELEWLLAERQEKLLMSKISEIAVSLNGYQVRVTAVLTAESIIPGIGSMFSRETLLAEEEIKRACQAAEAKSRLAAAIIEAGSRLEFVGGWKTE